MSLTILKIIPTIPAYLPGSAQQEKAKAFLNEFYNHDQVELTVTGAIEFVDPGQNFESLSCNVCGQEVPIEEWQDQMDKAYQGQFTDLTFQTSCQHQTSLNDLNYNWPAGFAKFTISISDPEHNLTENDLEQLQKILEAKLRMVWGRY